MPTFLAFLILILLVIGIVVLGIIISTLGGKFCLSKVCMEEDKFIYQNLDISINPCDNFYKFVCGNYGRSNRKLMSPRSVLEEIEEKELWRLVNFLKTPIKYEEPKAMRFFKTLYKNCNNLNQIETEGYQPLLKSILMTGGFPLVDESWNSMMSVDWEIVSAQANNFQYGYTFAQFWDIAFKKPKLEPSRILPYISIPSVLINNKQDFDVHYKHLVKIYTALTNTTISDEKHKELNETVQFKIDLIKLSKTSNSCSNVDEIGSFALLEDIVDKIGYPLDIIKMATGKSTKAFEEVIFSEGFLKYIEQVNTLVGTTPTHVLANYMALQNLIQVSHLLPRKLRKICDEYLTDANIQPIMKYTRRLLCAKCIKDQAATTMSALYLLSGKYFQTNEKIHEFVQLVEQIKQEFKTSVNDAKWMKTQDKYDTLAYIERIEFISPLPGDIMDDLCNETSLIYYHVGFCLPGDDILHDFLALVRFKCLYAFRIFENAKYWSIFDEKIDIFNTKITYDSVRNYVIIPMCFITYPMFENRWPKYLNYGSIGIKVVSSLFNEAHHAGSKLLTSGEQSEGDEPDTHWSNETITQYKKQRLCFFDQYNKYIEPLAKTKLSDSNCAEEIVALTGSVTLSYLSYQSYARNRFFPEPKLKSLSNYTVEQIYFITFAMLHCTNRNKLYTQYMSDRELGDISNEYKVIGSLQNSHHFIKAFNCMKGNKMYIKQCPLWK